MGGIKAATVSWTLRYFWRSSDDPQLESLGNLKKVLELSGSSLEKVVKFNSESNADEHS